MATPEISSPYDAGNRSAALSVQLLSSESLDYHFVRLLSPVAHSADRALDPSEYDLNDDDLSTEDWFVGGGQPGSADTGGPSSISGTPAGQATSEHEERHQITCASPPAEEKPGVVIVQLQPREKNRALQRQLAAAVLSHPYPLRVYCMEAYATALNLSLEHQRRSIAASRTPKYLPHSPSRLGSPRLEADIRLSGEGGAGELIHELVSGATTVCVVPLSVMLELTESYCVMSVNTVAAATHIGAFATQSCVSMLWGAAVHVAGAVPGAFELVVNAQRSAVGKTGEVFASGIQSVATGVGSVSNAALNRLTRQGLSLAGGVVGGSRSGLSHMGGGFGKSRKDAAAGENIFESKLFQRLQKVENVSKLVSYKEKKGEEAFSKHAKKRAQRIMHYQVSFRPFTATIQPKPNSPKKSKMKHVVSFELSSVDGDRLRQGPREDDNGSVSSESLDSHNSVFMRTPTSFPPTPTSRLYYFERGSRFTENVVFLARDQLRVERGANHRDEQTRAMSKALIDGRRLAVFDATDAAGNDIALSCGQHIATKVGNALYCSVRSMIPAMRNSCVYFEISVSPSRTNMSDPSNVAPTALSVGLSTLEMPLDTLVGAWSGSVGLCSTGQLLHAGEWSSPSDTQAGSYGSNCTVGCLVYLDDNSAYETMEGTNVVADVTFNINGNIVPSFASTEAAADQVCRRTSSMAKAQELFPTVTLHSPGACVMCRFSAEDLLANSRSEIGALDGVVVYAVDGSVILGAEDGDDALAPVAF
ncbi:hypothetical protein ACHAXT_003356 [Thalassiosira profunda]